MWKSKVNEDWPLYSTQRLIIQACVVGPYQVFFFIVYPSPVVLITYMLQNCFQTVIYWNNHACGIIYPMNQVDNVIIATQCHKCRI